MKTLIQLHYRRVLVGTLFYGLGSFLMFQALSDGAPVIESVLTALVFMIIVSVLGFMGVVGFPGFRVVMELGGLVFFASSAVQNSGLLFATSRLPDWVATCATFVLFAVVHQVVYGKWWQKSGLGLAVKLQSRFDTNLTPADTWARLVPNEHDLAAYYTQTLKGFDPVPDAPNTYVQKIGLGGSAVLELQIEVTESVPNERFAYRFHALTSERNRKFNRGSCIISLVALPGRGTHVEITEINEKLAVGDALLMWFDNLGAQVGASARAVLNGTRDFTLLGKLRREVRALS